MIKARNLSFTYPGSRSATISELTFDLSKGSFGLIEAPGGTGKSTLIKLLLGVYSPSSGELEVNGQQLHGKNNGAPLRRSIGIVSEGVELIADRTVAENVVLPLELIGAPKKESQLRLIDTLHRFGLGAINDEFPNALSEGERRRTKLARALVSEPMLLILDEPTLGLDPATATTLWDLLFREHQRGMTILAAASSIPPEPRFASCTPIPLGKG